MRFFHGHQILVRAGLFTTLLPRGRAFTGPADNALASRCGGCGGQPGQPRSRRARRSRGEIPWPRYVALLGGGAGLYFGKLQPEAEQARLEQAAQIARSEAELGVAKSAYDKTVRDSEAALSALRAANDEAARLKAQQAVDAANQIKLAAKGRLSGVQRTASVKTTGSGGGCVCEHPGDPMCGCLNR